jgi:hypothetical protein
MQQWYEPVIPFEAPAISRKNLPKNPAVGGTPANENKAMVSIHARTGLVLYKAFVIADAFFSCYGAYQ